MKSESAPKRAKGKPRAKADGLLSGSEHRSSNLEQELEKASTLLNTTGFKLDHKQGKAEKEFLSTFVYTNYDYII